MISRRLDVVPFTGLSVEGHLLTLWLLFDWFALFPLRFKKYDILFFLAVACLLYLSMSCFVDVVFRSYNLSSSCACAWPLIVSLVFRLGTSLHSHFTALVSLVIPRHHPTSRCHHSSFRSFFSLLSCCTLSGICNTMHMHYETDLVFICIFPCLGVRLDMHVHATMHLCSD